MLCQTGQHNFSLVWTSFASTSTTTTTIVLAQWTGTAPSDESIPLSSTFKGTNKKNAFAWVTFNSSSSWVCSHVRTDWIWPRSHIHKRGRFVKIVESAWFYSNLDPFRQESENSWHHVILRTFVARMLWHELRLMTIWSHYESEIHKKCEWERCASKFASVRAIRTVLLHCSPVTPNRQLKQSFQTLAALPVDMTSADATKSNSSTGRIRERSGQIPHFISCGSWWCSDRSLDASDSLWSSRFCWDLLYLWQPVSRAITAIGRRAVLYSNWNEFDLTRKAGTDKLKEDLPDKKPRVVWMTSEYRAADTSVSDKIIEYRWTSCLSLSPWLVKWDLCEAILEQMWGLASLGRGGVFFALREQFRNDRAPGCHRGNLADGTHSSKSWYFICSHRRWSHLLCSRRCLHDHPHHTMEKKTLRNRSGKQNSRGKFVPWHAVQWRLTASHLVAPAVSKR